MRKGQIFLHYRIQETLGQGGMGVVYRAEDIRLQRTVAIKCLTLQSECKEEEHRRFLAEARSAAALNHPHIATVFAVEEHEGELLLVMEYVEGEDLSRLLASRGAFKLERVKQIGLQVGSGLLAAHEKGIIHRDIKSSNIMLTDRGVVKIMDFGLARRMVDPHLTTPGATVGTLNYMSPEQVRGEAVDALSDQWSFGVVLYELCTGKLPFGGAYPPAIMYAIVNEDMLAFLPQLEKQSSHLIPVIQRCLQKNPANRFPDFAACLKALNDSAPVSTTSGWLSAPSKPSLKSWVRWLRSPALWMSLAVMCLSAMALALFLFHRQPASISAAAGKRTQQLVILPIKNIGGGESLQALCQGLVESLTSSVGQMHKFYGNLLVVPASEVRKNGINSPSEGMHQFNANLAVTGSLQKLPNLYRLTLNLVDAVHLRQISARVMDIEASQISELQSRAVEWLLQALSLKVNQEATATLQSHISTAPGAYEYYLQGKGYLSRPLTKKNADAPVLLFQKAIESDSTFGLAYAGLAEAYWRKHRMDKDPRWPPLAREAARKAIALDSSSSTIRVSVGNMYLGTGKYALAEKEFQSALAINPHDSDAHLGMARALQKLGHLKKAEMAYRRVIQMNPGYWVYYNSLGVFYYLTGQLEKAVEPFQQVIALSPDNIRGYANLGGTYYRLEKWAKAQEVLEHGLAIDAGPGLYGNLGTVYFIQGKYEKALEMYRKVAELKPHEHSAWGNLGSVSQWVPGQESQVMPFYRKAIERAEIERTVNPSDPDLLISLAQYYSMVGDTARSLSLARQSLATNPDNIVVLYGAAAAYDKLGFREKALKYIGEVLRRGNSVNEIRRQPEFKDLVADPRFKEVVARNQPPAQH